MKTPSRTLLGCAALLLLGLTASKAEAGYKFQSITNHSPANAREGEEHLAMTAEAVGDNQVRFRFTNTTLGSMSVLGVYFDDDDLLGGGFAAGSNATVVFRPRNPPEPFPPGGGMINPDFATSIQFSSVSQGSGIQGGEWLELTFDLLNNRKYQDVLAALEAGAGLESEQPTESTLRVGLLAQNFGTNDDDNESFLNKASDGPSAVPAPSAILLVASALPVLGLRQLRRRKVA